jgi:glycosyltransferase involved in cell wall biosynthesis
MRVAINAIFFRPEIRGGAETYLLNLTRGLAQLSETEVSILTNQSSAEYLRAHSDVRVESLTTRDFSHARALVWEQRELPKALKWGQFDLVHTVGGRTPSRTISKFAQIVTLYDLQHRDLPKNFSNPQRIVRECTNRWNFLNADYFVAISNFTKQRFTEKYSIPESKIGVAHLGGTEEISVGGSFSGRGVHLSKNEPFYYYPASFAPHKNHEILFRAMQVCRERRGTVGFRLVLSGKGTEANSKLSELARSFGVSNEVDFLGIVDYAEVRQLMSTCLAVVIPSRYEGFGLPVIESISLGTPVISSTSGSLPEVIGSAGVLVSPDDAEKWADWMTTLGQNQALLTDLKKNAVKQRDAFTWEKCAKDTRIAYQIAIESHSKEICS